MSRHGTLPTCYASFSLESRSMLAIWLDHRPSCDKDQRDPDGWVTDASGTDYEIARLAELAHAPHVKIVKLQPFAAAWWAHIEGNRRRKANREKRERAKEQQTLIPIPPEVEEEGKRAAVVYAQRSLSRGGS